MPATSHLVDIPFTLDTASLAKAVHLPDDQADREALEALAARAQEITALAIYRPGRIAARRGTLLSWTMASSQWPGSGVCAQRPGQWFYCATCGTESRPWPRLDIFSSTGWRNQDGHAAGRIDTWPRLPPRARSVPCPAWPGSGDEAWWDTRNSRRFFRRLAAGPRRLPE